MSMEKLILEVNELVDKEYGRAGARFGLVNHSDHESYAILLEELQEAKFEVDSVDRCLEEFWYYVKSNSTASFKIESCQRLHRRALLCACEMIQVAAMAKKASATLFSAGHETILGKEKEQ